MIFLSHSSLAAVGSAYCHLIDQHGREQPPMLACVEGLSIECGTAGRLVGAIDCDRCELINDTVTIFVAKAKAPRSGMRSTNILANGASAARGGPGRFSAKGSLPFYCPSPPSIRNPIPVQEAGNGLVTSPRLRVFTGGEDRLLSGGYQGHAVGRLARPHKSKVCMFVSDLRLGITLPVVRMIRTRQHLVRYGNAFAQSAVATPISRQTSKIRGGVGVSPVVPPAPSAADDNFAAR
ncbi:hypothetical protein EVAR_24728_1 [Eumeta japonica]|uniref:Uncharacterized protein n=1 Tax=Eumeta variegata TaxID=151549 RepID=A0A4C1VG91_EUMVA|nr:hypothetical protein EVAR_24728_1 [Eumeta japonica]